MSEKRFCSNCGNALKNNDNFCMECGMKIDSNIESSTISQNNNQTQNDQINYGSSPIMATTYVEQPIVKKDEKQNYFGIASIIVSILGFAFFLGDNSIFLWISLGICIVGIILGIIAQFQPYKKSQGIVGIMLNIVVLAVIFSIYFELF
ncbi:MAG: zinc-ribbon domain-containing protein [Candidatus Heimdallarchaeota archaeon]|nr:zinc-ribbon domain-containing protein [Candidatus Heimdallarchaeota archaeon]